jgi:hypothetical protein
LYYNQRDICIFVLVFGFTTTKELTFIKIDLKIRKLLKHNQNKFKVLALV